MAKSNAERQAALRLRRKAAGIGRLKDAPRLERLDLWLASSRKRELEVLAALQGRPMREVVESLIETAAAAAKARDKARWSETALHLLNEARKGLTPSLETLVREAVQAAPKTPSGLVELVGVIRGLMAQGHSLSDIHEALREQWRWDILEMRVESGLQRLTPEELALCPEGLQGSRLSLARIRDGVTR